MHPAEPCNGSVCIDFSRPPNMGAMRGQRVHDSLRCFGAICCSQIGVSTNGGTPIAGWFNNVKNRWFGGTPIPGNLQIGLSGRGVNHGESEYKDCPNVKYHPETQDCSGSGLELFILGQMTIRAGYFIYITGQGFMWSLKYMTHVGKIIIYPRMWPCCAISTINMTINDWLLGCPWWLVPFTSAHEWCATHFVHWSTVRPGQG